jgi:opacity protein-like surface antigen
MKWKIAVPVLALAGFLAGAPAHALGGGFVFGVQGGGGVPTGDYGDEFSSGFNFGGTVDYMLMPMFSLGADLGYHSNNAKDEVNQEFSDSLSSQAGFPVTGEIKANALQYGAHVMFMPPVPGGIHPYVQVGVAQYNTKLRFEGGGVKVDVESNQMGFNVGGGALFNAAPLVGVGVDVRYHNVGTKDDFGADLTWLAVSARLTVKLPTP